MRIAIVPLVALCLACGSVNPQSLASWRETVVAAHQQSDVALRGVNDMAREEALTRVVTKETISESDLTPAFDAASLRIWNATFADLESYAAALEQLVDPNLAAPVGESLATLGQNMAAKAKSDVFQKQPGLADAVSKAGGAIAGAAAQREAQSIMRDTNPAIQSLLSQMGAMLVTEIDGVETGAIASATALYTTSLARKQIEFKKATSAGAKRQIALEFGELIDKRNASDDVFRQLKSTLDSLAIDHAAAANGQTDFSGRVTALREETKLAQEILDDLKKKP
jgi:hypothetical protein